MLVDRRAMIGPNLLAGLSNYKTKGVAGTHERFVKSTLKECTLKFLLRNSMLHFSLLEILLMI